MLKVVTHWASKSESIESVKYVVTHYNPSSPITLAASCRFFVWSGGHHTSDGSKHPIAFTSHTLTIVEKNYGQLAKEALAST